MLRMNRAACGALLALSPWLAIGCSGTGNRPVATTKPHQAADQRVQMARQYERDGDLQKAEKVYRQLQQESPRSSDYAHRLGVIYTRMGAHQQAAEQFDKALRSDPQDARLLSDAGYAEYLRGNLTAAARHLEQALEQQQDNKRAVNNLALVYGHQGRFDESLALFRRYSSETEALASLANIHRQRGDDDLALACYEEILELDPSNSAAAAAVASLSSARPEDSSEVAAAETSLPLIPDDEAPLPAEEFLQINQQNVSADDLRGTEATAHPLADVANAAETEQTDEFEAPIEVTEAPVGMPEAPADDSFELPVVQPGRPELAVQPDAAQVTVESGWQIESNEVQTRVLAPQAAPVIADAEPADELFEAPEVATDATATAEAEVPAETSPQTAAPAAMMLGMGGYCPVSLRNDREIVAGAEAWEAEYKGVTYRFATPEALAEFHVAPDIYIPVAGGLDVVAVREGREVTAGSLEHATWFRDRLYLFASADTLAAFRSNARTFADGY